MVDLLQRQHPAFKQGETAHREGKTIADNKYPRLSLKYKIWLRGFMFAMQNKGNAK